jgi:hypothetical protein
MSDNHDHVSPEPLIDSKQVVTILTDCLFTEEELVEGVLSEDADAVIANGILFNYAFHPQRLESHREEVEQMLCNLPLAFRPSAVGGGGGWTFLNACQDANDVQWTGEHRVMEILFCLGIALGVAEWSLPRDLWEALPGGMPYVAVKV